MSDNMESAIMLELIKRQDRYDEMKADLQVMKNELDKIADEMNARMQSIEKTNKTLSEMEDFLYYVDEFLQQVIEVRGLDIKRERLFEKREYKEEEK